MNQRKKLQAFRMVALVGVGLLMGSALAGAKSSEADASVKSKVHKSLQASSNIVRGLVLGEYGLSGFAVADALTQLLDKNLGLSAEQVTTVKTCLADYETALIWAEAQVEQEKPSLLTWLISYDHDNITASQNAIKKSEATLSDLHLQGLEAMQKAAAVLTPEQRMLWFHRITSHFSFRKLSYTPPGPKQPIGRIEKEGG